MENNTGDEDTVKQSVLEANAGIKTTGDKSASERNAGEKSTKFYARPGNMDNKSDWQQLSGHLMGSSARAGVTGARLGIGGLARIATLAHDLGKYNPAFQQRLEGKPGVVDHSTAGAKILLDMAKTGEEKFFSQIAAFAILGHHAGLPDYSGDETSFERRLKKYRDNLDKQKIRLDPAWKKEIPVSLDGLKPECLGRIMQSSYAGVDLSFVTRMVFSCLVDADRCDSEAFCKALMGQQMDRDWPPLQSLLPDFLTRYDKHMHVLCNKSGELNRLRGEILRTVRANASRPKGFFTLTVPTGGGKTLASLGFALDHAKIHALDRIIYAIPYTSIIDQTAGIFKDLLGAEYVLEHHSSFDVGPKADLSVSEDGDCLPHREKVKAAMEDWGAPVIVTTNVQMFESLYSSRPSAARKLKNIANSVIILDEAQVIPLDFLAPCMRALDTLVRLFNCTVVLCTATQPAVDEAHMVDDRRIAALPLAGKELAPDPEHLAGRLRRATLRLEAEMDNAALVAALARTKQGLVIVNSRPHASDLYKECKEAGLDGLIHLTTRQCAAHRRQILHSIRERLKAGAPCRVIATSLVEAGVDLDFPHVWRAEAGLDQVLQAAGRCNREGLRNADESIVTVFRAEEKYDPPSEIKRLAGNLQKILPRHGDNLQSPKAIEAYFRHTYWQRGKALDKKEIIRRLTPEAGLPDFPFRSIGREFCMINDTMLPVVIPWDDAARDIVGKMSVETISSSFIARRLQPYIVRVPLKFHAKLVRDGYHADYQAQHLRANQFAVLKTASLYRDDVGLVWENADYLGEDGMIVST